MIKKNIFRAGMLNGSTVEVTRATSEGGTGWRVAWYTPGGARIAESWHNDAGDAMAAFEVYRLRARWEDTEYFPRLTRDLVTFLGQTCETCAAQGGTPELDGTCAMCGITHENTCPFNMSGNELAAYYTDRWDKAEPADTMRPGGMLTLKDQGNYNTGEPYPLDDEQRAASSEQRAAISDQRSAISEQRSADIIGLAITERANRLGRADAQGTISPTFPRDDMDECETCGRSHFATCFTNTPKTQTLVGGNYDD